MNAECCHSDGWSSCRSDTPSVMYCATCLRGWKKGHGNHRCIVMVCKLITGQSVRMDKYPVMEACGARLDLSTRLVQVLTALPLLPIGWYVEESLAGPPRGDFRPGEKISLGSSARADWLNVFTLIRRAWHSVAEWVGLVLRGLICAVAK